MTRVTRLIHDQPTKGVRKDDCGRPKLVTEAWLEDVSRIKRRVTTNGSEDMGVIQAIIASLHSRPALVSQAEKFVVASFDAEEWDESLQDTLTVMCLFSYQKFEVHWDRPGEKMDPLQCLTAICDNRFPFVHLRIVSQAVPQTALIRIG